MCGSSARTDLYGGRSAMTVPTVTGTGTLAGTRGRSLRFGALKGREFGRQNLVVRRNWLTRGRSPRFRSNTIADAHLRDLATACVLQKQRTDVSGCFLGEGTGLSFVNQTEQNHRRSTANLRLAHSKVSVPSGHEIPGLSLPGGFNRRQLTRFEPVSQAGAINLEVTRGRSLRFGSNVAIPEQRRDAGCLLGFRKQDFGDR